MKYTIVFLFILSLIVPTLSVAADLRLVPTEIPVMKDQLIGIAVKLDAGSAPVNAFELKVQFDDSKLLYKNATDATAVTSFWIRYPYVCETGVLCLSGMIPGGFSGLDQELVIVYFTTKESGMTTLLAQDVRVLAHDGKGTEMPVTSTPLKIEVEESRSPSQEQQAVFDTDPPEPFVPQIARDEAVEGGAQVLIFDTKDKQSGVASYYVKEYTLPFLRFFTPWNKAESPYVLLDQSLNSIIAVKAVDVSGNERISYIKTEEGSVYQNIFVAICLVLIACLIVWFYVRRQKRSGVR